MAQPCFAVTGDDARFYVSPIDPMKKQKKSITTIKKQGVPNHIMELWRGKEVALFALANLELLAQLEARVNEEN